MKTIIDPHTSVALASSEKCIDEYDLQIILSTAHPAKFKDTVVNLLKNDNFVTDKVKSIMNMTNMVSYMSHIRKEMNNNPALCLTETDFHISDIEEYEETFEILSVIFTFSLKTSIF